VEVGFTAYKMTRKVTDILLTYEVRNQHGDLKDKGEVNQSRVVNIYPGDIITLTVPADLKEEE
jgi:hypothetical protein